MAFHVERELELHGSNKSCTSEWWRQLSFILVASNSSKSIILEVDSSNDFFFRMEVVASKIMGHLANYDTEVPLTADACHCLFTVDFLIHLNSKGFTPRQYLVWYRCSVRTLKPKCIDSLSQFNHLLHSKLLRRMVSPMPNRATKMVKSEILRITKNTNSS